MLILVYFFSAIFLLALLTFALSYLLHFFGRKSPLYPSYAFVLDQQEKKTALDRFVANMAQQYNGLGQEKDALALVIGNIDAFAGRASASALAERSLDLMYYIWEDDLTGRLLLHEVLKAADRGVRVRLLLDDINAYGRDPIFAALDQHERIEIRLFNPVLMRTGPIKRGIEMVLRALSLTRRMHNKAYIVDGRLAFVGGRNIGDPYFDVSRLSNFRDLDVLLLGRSVAKMEKIFDRYWNSVIAQPIKFFVTNRKGKDLEKWRKTLEQFCNESIVQNYVKYIQSYDLINRLLRVNRVLFEAKKVDFLFDPPEKALQTDTHEWMIIKLFEKLKQAKSTLEITSPYFVPGKVGVNFLSLLTKKGIKVKILTNSLAAIDVPLVYSGYMGYRKGLLKGGVELFELKSDCNIAHKLRFLHLRKASLHTKAFLIDKRFGFVGSFNFDSRSVSLNTEMGIFFECKPLTQRMELLFDEETTKEMSYKLTLDKHNKIIWHWGKEDQFYQSQIEPDCSLWRRYLVKLLSWLPIESQL